MANINLKSEQFEEDGTLPRSAAYPGAGGANRSPQLSWGELPAGTRSLALSCWDPDAPTTVGFTHWVRFDISPTLRELAEGSGSESGQWVDGLSDWGEVGWGGMAPPAGDPPHHYEFTLYALDVEELGLDERTTYAKFRFVCRGHVLGTGTLVGRFGLPA